MNILNNLENYYACDKVGGFISTSKLGNIINPGYLYTFKIYQARLEIRCCDEFIVYVRGQDTCWFSLDSLILDEDEEALLDYVESQHLKDKLKTRTYTITAGNFD